MKKSISKSMVFSGVFLAVSVFTVVTLIFAKFIEANALEEKAVLLESNVDRIANFTYTARTNQSAVVDSMYQYMIDNMSYNTQTSIIIFDNNGIITAKSSGTEKPTLYQKVDEKASKKVLSGNKIVSTDIYKDTGGDRVLTVGAPLLIGGEIFGGVIFNQRVPEIQNAYRKIIFKLTIIVIIAMLLSALIFYIISKFITTPIKRISFAVTQFSKGDFSQRVNYTSDNELGELADNINHMAQSLENLENLRSGFISDISHELRTPMTSISGFVEGILDGTIPQDDEREYLEIVLSESKRLSRLVTNLLQVSKMENDDVKITKTNFDINELVRQALLKFEKAVTEKNITVSLELDYERMTVFADKDSITQVIMNLLNNAVKFTDVGGKIDVSVSDLGNKANVTVRNSGHGIEPDKIDFIWDRFYKTDKSRSMDKTGVGLGLYIVKKIIDKHGEKIYAKSVIDSYTEFTFTLAKYEV